jgi:hypothetical protein
METNGRDCKTVLALLLLLLLRVRVTHMTVVRLTKKAGCYLVGLRTCNLRSIVRGCEYLPITRVHK